MTTTDARAPGGLESALWRAVAVYRWLALAYAAAMIVRNQGEYARPAGGWAVLAVMVVWTAAATALFADGRRRGPALLAADMAVALGCLLATAYVETSAGIAAGRPTLPVSWVAAAVLAWAVQGGRRWGVAGAGILAAGNALLHVLAGSEGPHGTAMFNGIVLLFLAGLVVGHVVRLAREAEARLARAVELEAATRERERLARGIHDSVLQVLAMVRRRGAELGGEAAGLGRLAGEQEAALRALIGAAAPAPPAGTADLGALLAAHGSTTVSVAAPATPVPLPAAVAREIDAAVAAALDNVARHCGPSAPAWVLLEDDPDAVVVSVRDDGPGIEPGRLDAAQEAGRLGVAQSIVGRVRDLGGTVEIASAPGAGTEIEISVPRHARARARKVGP
ncbi:Sensor histidine kinase LiaS [Actinomadura rubteroloni]|uniref:Sensor histidine kinase LiaS n=1 Tax=Actinomadura rubteroloni TaxID=1926885 RepID=A0A2P4UGE7_9ACTN|nr:DUF5931 domain-containing protein [Actinomadura rubteroloni]POM24127.1 Sensor histidine kinase LiaS [Actinomadura rubteroloni]